MMFSAIVVLSCLDLVGCSKSNPSAGTERGPCYGNGTCNAGLICRSELCVAADPASTGSTAASSSAATAREPSRRKSEAAVQLNKIGKNAKRAYAETSVFPTGEVSLTPATPCCQGPDRHCVTPSSAWADNPVWKMLDFEINEPALFQYSYRSDGKTFTATAVGDLDCDGVMITYEMTGTSVNGNPSMTLIEPPPNAD